MLYVSQSSNIIACMFPTQNNSRFNNTLYYVFEYLEKSVFVSALHFVVVAKLKNLYLFLQQVLIRFGFIFVFSFLIWELHFVINEKVINCFL